MMRFMRKILLGLVKMLSPGSKYWGPPKRVCLSTYRWFLDQRKSTGAFKIRYEEVIPEHTLERALPIGLEDSVDWRFEKNLRREIPPAFLLTIENARVVGSSGAILTDRDELLADISKELGKPVDQHSVLTRWKLPPLKKLEGKVVVFATSGGHNYYHWLLDVLPRFYLLRCGRVDLSKISFFLINEGYRQEQKQVFEQLGIPTDRIIECCPKNHWQARELMIPFAPASRNNPTSWICHFLRDIFASSIEKGKQDYPKRLYISRSNAKKRHVLNEEKLIIFLRSLGFETVDLENILIHDQIALFRSAEIIVGAHGAGLSNLVFCGPQAQVIELFSPAYVNGCYWALAEQVGVRYAYLLGEGQRPVCGDDPHRVGEDMMIRIDDLACLLRKMKVTRQEGVL
ncbi:MAG: glycosyltransferase family 61 protein [Candidatus Omnitrophica bacterium]|nr:glycosyltransferase family 61 protein [Candidatus Omnitrophota bacterium]